MLQAHRWEDDMQGTGAPAATGGRRRQHGTWRQSAHHRRYCNAGYSLSGAFLALRHEFSQLLLMQAPVLQAHRWQDDMQGTGVPATTGGRRRQHRTRRQSSDRRRYCNAKYSLSGAFPALRHEFRQLLLPCRLLCFKLTDGKTTCKALEFRPLQGAEGDSIAPGA